MFILEQCFIILSDDLLGILNTTVDRGVMPRH
jgi:hypothetical protein